MRTIGNIILFIIAVVLSPLLLIGIMYGLWSLLWKRRFADAWYMVGDYFYRAAVSIDQLGNTMCCELFNRTLIKEGGYSFGNVDETISSVLGKNKQMNKLSRVGKLLDGLLHIIDENHTTDSIENEP